MEKSEPTVNVVIAAERLHVSIRTVYHMLHDGRLIGDTSRASVRVTTSSIQRYLDSLHEQKEVAAVTEEHV